MEILLLLKSGRSSILPSKFGSLFPPPPPLFFGVGVGGGDGGLLFFLLRPPPGSVTIKSDSIYSCCVDLKLYQERGENPNRKSLQSWVFLSEARVIAPSGEQWQLDNEA